MTLFDRLRGHAVAWRPTGSAAEPYYAQALGHRLRLRVNDFPAEALYTLLVDGEPVGHLDRWPAGWRRPASA